MFEERGNPKSQDPLPHMVSRPNKVLTAPARSFRNSSSRGDCPTQPSLTD